MRKLGRNDPCYCGSGKKYKSCCLPADEANKVVRLAPPVEREEPEEDRPVGPQEITDLIEHELVWAPEGYKLIARGIANLMRSEGGSSWEDIAAAIEIWYVFCHQSPPAMRSRSFRVFAAALHYLVAAQNGRTDVTQAGVADLYGVSVSSVSRRCGEIMDAVESAFLEEFDDLLAGGEKDAASRPAPASLAGPLKPAAKQQAADMLFEAWETRSEKKRLLLARRALELYPDSPDAYNILAESARTLEEARDLYYQGMKAGERDLGDLFEQFRGHFWGFHETRPYMRSKQGYAETCEMLGDLDEAIRHYEEMLELNPNDNQGIRYMLFGAYCQLARYEQANELLERYPEQSAHYAYDRMLVEYGLNGFSLRMKSLLRTARKHNPYVPAYLTGKKGLPHPMPETYIVGEESEAIVYASERLYVWSLHMPLIHWLSAQK
jgi:tetratricopeptide (TPR) repeat protein